MESRLVRLLCGLIGACLFAGSALADGPIRTPAPDTRPNDAEDEAVSALPDEGLRPALVPSTIPPVPGRHRGGILTNAGAASTQPHVTGGELTKLAMARDAVAAARAAGTLYVTPIEFPIEAHSLDDLVKIKGQALASRPPLVLAPDPAAGVGDHTVVQEIGPAGPTAQELAKLPARSEEGGAPR